MPLFYQQNINVNTRLAIWEIAEDEIFFDLNIPLHTEITHPHKKLQHLAGRYLLPFLMPGFPTKEIEIADTRKPFLPNEQYHFSISHCSRYAAAIVSNQQRVGIDVELITPRLDKIKMKFLHASELRFVNAQAISHQLTLLSILWSAKESMYKWFGEGEVDFRENMRTFPFTAYDQGEVDAVFMKEDFKQKLVLHYKIFNLITLVWIES